jgi:hypothetical protein
MSSIAWFIYFFIWIIINFNELPTNFSGANIEMLTPIFFIVMPFFSVMVRSLSFEILNRTLKSYLNLLLIFLCIEMIIRYLIEPGCFLNYSCRFAGKTVGFFSTTNALATSLVFVLLCFSNFFYHRFKKILFYFILVSSMARAAILSFLVVKPLQIFSKFKLFTKMFFTCLFVFAFLLFLYEDPINLRGDGSLLSKFDFFESALKLAKSADIITNLIGYGANFETITSRLNVNGWSPHAPILKSYMYFGFFGVILYLLNLLGMLLISKRLILPIFAFLILGLAGAPIFFPTICVGIFIAHALNKTKIDQYA